MFDHIIGYNAVKNELLKFLDIMKNPVKYQAFNVPIPHGIILYGPPGTGKTMFAMDFIQNSGRKYFILRRDCDDSELMININSTFKSAVENSPSIIFIDDIDKFGDTRVYNTNVLSSVQTNIDIVTKSDVFVIATANCINCIDGPLTRPGRFDRLINVTYPEGQTAYEITKYYASNKKVDPSVDMNVISEILSGTSCATLESVINSAALYAAYESSPTIKMNHLTDAILSVVYSKPPTDFDPPKEDKTIVAYHEAGHASLLEILYPGSAALSTIRRFNRDDGCITVHGIPYKTANIVDALNRIRIGLGGKAAEECKFGYCSIGSYNDMNSVFSEADKIVGGNAYYGFQYAYYDNAGRGVYDRSEMYTYNLVESLYGEAVSLLRQNWNLVEAIAQALLIHETITQKDIVSIKANLGYPIIK